MFVSRIGNRSAHVAGRCRIHAIELAIGSLDAPETSSAESDHFGALGHLRFIGRSGIVFHGGVRFTAGKGGSKEEKQKFAEHVITVPEFPALSNERSARAMDFEKTCLS